MYLIDIDDQRRESEAIRHLLSSQLLVEYVLGPLGLGQFCWVLAEVDNTHLIPSIKGEVDVLAGRLEFRAPEDFQHALKRWQAEYPNAHPSWPELIAAKEVSEAGGLLWPPRIECVVGVEVKCAYFSDRIYSAKDSRSHVRRIRKQLDRLAYMGVDRTALLDVLGNPPSQGANLNPWFEAARRADDTLHAAKSILDARLSTDSASAQFVWSAGAVAGGDESLRGAGAPLLIRPGTANPALAAGNAQVLANRNVLLSRLLRTLGDLPTPTSFPAQFIGCKACGGIRNFRNPVCDCGGRPTSVSSQQST